LNNFAQRTRNISQQNIVLEDFCFEKHPLFFFLPFFLQNPLFFLNQHAVFEGRGFDRGLDDDGSARLGKVSRDPGLVSEQAGLDGEEAGLLGKGASLLGSQGGGGDVAVGRGGAGGRARDGRAFSGKSDGVIGGAGGFSGGAGPVKKVAGQVHKLEASREKKKLGT
jgi:hypothetical protein